VRTSAEWSLWGGAVVLTALSVVTWRAARPEPTWARTVLRPALVADAIPAETLGTRVLQVISADPFRLERTPSRAPFGEPMDTDIAALPARTPPPDLQLRGLTGPPWRAVLESPGSASGVLAAPGDTVAGVRIVDVRHDRVVLRTSDTSWVLTMKLP